MHKMYTSIVFLFEIMSYSIFAALIVLYTAVLRKSNHAYFHSYFL